MNKRGLMFALRWASIQCSSQFSSLHGVISLFSLFIVSTIGNKENVHLRYNASVSTLGQR